MSLADEATEKKQKSKAIRNVNRPSRIEEKRGNNRRGRPKSQTIQKEVKNLS